MTTIAMENLWKYIQGLNLSRRNQLWLEQHLHEARQASSAEDTLTQLNKSFAEFRQMQDGKLEGINAEDLLDEL